MGGSKDTGTTVVQSGSSSQSRKPTAEETRLNELDVELREATQPGLIEMQKQGAALGGQLLSGNTPLPGWMAGMTGGITDEMTDEIVQDAFRDVDAQMAGQGILDSGTRASSLSRTSGDIRRATAEYNLGNKMNLLNLALTGQAQVQSPILGFAGSLGNRLQSAGTVTKSYSGTQNTSTGNNGMLSFGAV